MNAQELCDCTVHCPGRHACEIGTWVRPCPVLSKALAEQLLRPIAQWLRDAPRSRNAVGTALFDRMDIGNAVARIDSFYSIWEVLDGMYGNPGQAQVQSSQTTQPLNECPDEPVRLKGIDSPMKPVNFSRVIELMAFFNTPWLAYGHMRTSEIAAMMFPDASQVALDTWLTQALDDTLYRIGYSPVSATGNSGQAGVHDDPEWFCDGDTRDAIHHNLWNGCAL